MAPKNKTKKINLPYVNNRDNRITINTNMKDYILAYVKLMKDVYIGNRDIEVDYNDIYNLYRVSIFKQCDAGLGSGTSEYRDRLWKQTQQAIEELFNIESKNISWRWIHTDRTKYDQQKNYDTPEPNYIPGYRYFIFENSLND